MAQPRRCGCRMWETKNGDTEEYLCPRHAGTIVCHIGEIEGCKFYHIESEDEAWCEHPKLDQKVVEEYCPIRQEEFANETV